MSRVKNYETYQFPLFELLTEALGQVGLFIDEHFG